MRNLSSRYAIFLLLLMGITACPRLPEYAKPRTIQVDKLDKGSSIGFNYRTLTPEDFRASSLPENPGKPRAKINAQSVILIRPTFDSNFRITRLPLPDQVIYQGSIIHIAFEAVMIPEESWWNPKINGAQTDYVLKHEQIHFALEEIAARKLTLEAQKWAADFTMEARTPHQVYSEIVRQIKEKIEKAMEAIQKRHLQFDKDTSLYYAPSWQDWWLKKVEEELKKTGPER